MFGRMDNKTPIFLDFYYTLLGFSVLVAAQPGLASDLLQADEINLRDLTDEPSWAGTVGASFCAS